MENKNIERELDNPQEEKKIKTAVNDISADTAVIKTCMESISQQLPILAATREDVNDVIVLLSQYIEKLDDATGVIKRGVTVKVLPVELSEEHVSLLNDIKSGYDIRNQRWERLCQAVANTGKLKVYLTAIISVLLTVGVMVFVFRESHYVWAHRALVAAEQAHHEDPVAEYSKCFIGMQEDWRQYRQIVKGMEANAKLIMSTESILSKYIEEPFEVRGCEEHVHGGPVLVNCRLLSNDTHVMYRMHLDANRIVTKVEKEKKTKSKVVWEEVNPVVPEPDERQ